MIRVQEFFATFLAVQNYFKIKIINKESLKNLLKIPASRLLFDQLNLCGAGIRDQYLMLLEESTDSILQYIVIAQ